MKNSKIFFIIFLLTVLTGCVAQPQVPIQFARESLPTNSNIGVVMESMPDIQTTFPGAGCLLCLATASVANSSLSKHVQSFSAKDLLELKSEVKANLEAQDHNVILINRSASLEKLPKVKSKAPNSAKRDFKQFKTSNNIEYLVVIDIDYVGVQRNYSSYIPTAAPQAVVTGAGYMVNLNSNTYVWYAPLKIYRSAEGEWDEPPNFPGMTNAFYQAIEQARDAITKPLAPEIQNASR